MSEPLGFNPNPDLLHTEIPTSSKRTTSSDLPELPQFSPIPRISRVAPTPPPRYSNRNRSINPRPDCPTRTNPDFGIPNPRPNLYQNLFNSITNPPATNPAFTRTATENAHPITFKEQAQIEDFDRILTDLDKKVKELEDQFELAAKKVQLTVLRGIIRRRNIAGIPVPLSIVNATLTIN